MIVYSLLLRLLLVYEILLFTHDSLLFVYEILFFAYKSILNYYGSLFLVHKGHINMRMEGGACMCGCEGVWP
jgi:hypothetical protein